MFKNKTDSGNNIAGRKLAKLRKNSPSKMSQRILAERMQLFGVDLDKNAIQRIESGQRFITDIELLAFSKVFQVSCDELLSEADDSLIC